MICFAKQILIHEKRTFIFNMFHPLFNRILAICEAQNTETIIKSYVWLSLRSQFL